MHRLGLLSTVSEDDDNCISVSKSNSVPSHTFTGHHPRAVRWPLKPHSCHSWELLLPPRLPWLMGAAVVVSIAENAAGIQYCLGFLTHQWARMTREVRKPAVTQGAPRSASSCWLPFCFGSSPFFLGLVISAFHIPQLLGHIKLHKLIHSLGNPIGVCFLWESLKGSPTSN